MRRPLWVRWCLPIVLLAAALGALAQQNPPRVGFVYPAGGRQGDTFQAKVGGQFLDGVNTVYVSGTGVQATVIEHTKPMTPRALRELREKIQELQKKGRDAATLSEIASIRAKIATFSRNANPAISERVALQVTVAPDAEPGSRQLRLRTPLGVSNPLVFCVGQLPEFLEKEGNGGTANEITVPATVNGQLIPGSSARYRLQVRQSQQYLPGDVDRYSFHARKGQNLVVAVSARSLIPYLADAVPGWFQATVALFDSAGRELAYDDDFRFDPDPVLHYRISVDGEYSIEIKDALFRGRDDFVYRLTIAESPYVTSIFPLGGSAGTRTTVALAGWNLPVSTMAVEADNLGPGIREVAVSSTGLVSNRRPFAVDNLPEVVEKEPNDSQTKAQRVALPVIVNGHIDRPADSDVFRFEGRAGDAIVAEVLARRLDSPLDSVLRLTDPSGNQLALNDDHEDKGSGLDTHHADSYIATTLPKDGDYFLYLGDAQHKGGAEYAYRLRIGPPRPGFDLRVVPSSINVAAGATTPLAVYALRRDGFAGDIAVSLKNAPAGFMLRGGQIPSGKDSVRLTLTVPPGLSGDPAGITVEGRAQIQAQTVNIEAVPADDMMQAFAYRHLVPAKDLRVTVLARPGLRAMPRPPGEQLISIPAGGSARVRFTLPPLKGFENVQYELSDPPEGFSIAESLPTRWGAELVVQCDAAKVKPGLKGNLIVSVSGERAGAPANVNAPANRRRLPLGILPAIAFEVVP
jgi:Bacterial pre-peptidase C-terminal domain